LRDEAHDADRPGAVLGDDVPGFVSRSN